MAVEPTGIESLVLDALRTSLSLSTTFQTWVGATGTASEKAAFAKARVYEVYEDDYTVPCAVVDYGPMRRESIAAGISVQEGDVGVLFIGSVNSEHDEADAERAFMNKAGAVVSEIEALSTTGGCLAITEYGRPGKPERLNEDEAATVGDRYEVEYPISYMGA